MTFKFDEISKKNSLMLIQLNMRIIDDLKNNDFIINELDNNWVFEKNNIFIKAIELIVKDLSILNLKSLILAIIKKMKRIKIKI